MSRIGVNLSIDVTKLDKARFYKGAKGTYANLTAYIDSEKDQYDQNGGIQEQATQDERANKVKMPFVGNVKIFWTDSPAIGGSPKQAEHAAALADEDIPF
jgi:hypothetical protein